MEYGAEPQRAAPTRLRDLFRINLRFAMLLVLAAGLGAAAWIKVYGMLGASADPEVVDVPNLVVIAILFGGMAIGGFRRYTGAQCLTLVATTYLLVAAPLQLAEMHPRATRYWLQIGFAITVAVPLTVQGWVLRTRAWNKPENRRIRMWAEAFGLANFNLALTYIGVILSWMGAEYLNEATAEARKRRANPAPAAAAPGVPAVLPPAAATAGPAPLTSLLNLDVPDDQRIAS